jgi:hypothetical protein
MHKRIGARQAWAHNETTALTSNSWRCRGILPRDVTMCRSMHFRQSAPERKIGAQATLGLPAWSEATDAWRSLLVQLIEQRPGVLQVGGVEALGEPVVDLREHRARLITTTGVAQ